MTMAKPKTNARAPLSLSFFDARIGISSIVVYINAPPASAITYGSTLVKSKEMITVIIPSKGIGTPDTTPIKKAFPVFGLSTSAAAIVKVSEIATDFNPLKTAVTLEMVVTLLLWQTFKEDSIKVQLLTALMVLLVHLILDSLTQRFLDVIHKLTFFKL